MVTPEKSDRLLLDAITNWFVASTTVFYVIHLIGVFVLSLNAERTLDSALLYTFLPVGIFLCLWNIREARKSETVVVWKASLQKADDPTLYAMWLGAYWLASILGVIFLLSDVYRAL